MSKRTPKAERAVRIVYLLVDRKTGRAVAAAVSRAGARYALPAFENCRVVRCEVVETRRKAGGA